MNAPAQRWKLTIEYDGTGYVGWQRQDNGMSIQAALEEAAGNLCQMPIIMHGCGRTDAGVHAFAQVAHCDMPEKLTAQNLLGGLNFYLGDHKIAVHQVEQVAADFHARHHARMRYYCYRLRLCATTKAAIQQKKMWHVRDSLDMEAMQKAARALVGQHDFESFRAAECQAKSALRTLDRLEIIKA
ncbi:MAG: tRNA pseudouridine synthase A, partial [Pseudomonadota bacterium]